MNKATLLTLTATGALAAGALLDHSWMAERLADGARCDFARPARDVATLATAACTGQVPIACSGTVAPASACQGAAPAPVAAPACGGKPAPQKSVLAASATAPAPHKVVLVAVAPEPAPHKAVLAAIATAPRPLPSPVATHVALAAPAPHPTFAHPAYSMPARPAQPRQSLPEDSGNGTALALAAVLGLIGVGGVLHWLRKPAPAPRADDGAMPFYGLQPQRRKQGDGRRKLLFALLATGAIAAIALSTARGPVTMRIGT
ncbi:MAG: hypothetical protein KGL44_09150, partial [Sphingomonadales bacterium]|nr:hypothetical protein [Sphingomonadales bacterium]